MTNREQFEDKYALLMGKTIASIRDCRHESGYREREGYTMEIAWRMWQASRAAIEKGTIVAYQDFYGNAISAGDFDGGEEEMHETAFNEQWTPLIKADGLKVKK